MALIKKSITVTDRQQQWIRAQVASGEYGSDSEYFRDLIRRDQEQDARFRALKIAIQEGLESGVADKTVKEIWAEAEDDTERSVADYRLSSVVLRPSGSRGDRRLHNRDVRPQTGTALARRT